ncbi:MAG: trypsin-like peptidase domain-containing protein [Defluviitaleaceae bacterium]|nr:trypsin-like peptidase domain-containing protein [Defluviitaleaceae bacterium]
MQNSHLNQAGLQYKPTATEPKQDFSWLTDISMIQAEIQAEIEKDLERPSHTSKWDYTETEGSTMWPPHETRLTEDTQLVSTDSPAVDADVSASFVSPGFYKETIKVLPSKTRSWPKTIAAILLICIFGMGSLGFGIGAAYIWATNRMGYTPAPETVTDDSVPPTITSNRYTFDIGEMQTGTVADMVELLEPAVVSITTRFEAGARAPIAGSGTIFGDSEDRIFIATGHYVVPLDGIIHVRISGSRPITARFVNSNRQNGLAVISVYKSLLTDAGIDSYTIATFGDSSMMQVGDVVFAIGNARNEGISVTRGIVSAGKQDLVFPEYTLTVLQTDAAINYGSSGGPLINLRGEVIGINIDRAMMLFGSAPIEGIGYSIASNVAIPVLDSIICPDRPALGITGRTVNDEVAALFGGIPAMGVWVTTVNPGGAADMAGMLPNDIITAFDGEPVFLMEELVDAILMRRIGDVVEVRVLREGEELINLEVVLQASIQ